MEWYISQLWVSYIISLNITSIAYNQYTDIYSQTYILYTPSAVGTTMCEVEWKSRPPAGSKHLPPCEFQWRLVTMGGAVGQRGKSKSKSKSTIEGYMSLYCWHLVLCGLLH